jgi:HEAT repeats
VTATEQDIGARVDALSQALEGEEFVAAVERLADSLDPTEKETLQEVLLERAAEEDDLQQAVRRRFAEKGWTRRTLARVEGLWRDDRADSVAVAIQAGPDGEAALEAELDLLRDDRGRAAVVLDELSRHSDARVRAWVPEAAAELLGESGGRLILSLTRDREREVRDAAVRALVGLGPEASRLALPDLRRRLHSSDVRDRIAAILALGDAGDVASLGIIEERAASAETPDEREEARSAAVVLRAKGADGGS